jgi:PhnB protein
MTRSIPEGSSRVIPRLVCRDPSLEVDFCLHVLDAVELGRRLGPDGRAVHALLTIGFHMIMIEGEWPTLPSRALPLDGTSPVLIFVYVENVDATVDRALEHGAEVLVPAQDQFWGDRIAWIMDPSGHVWTLATRLQETTREERNVRWASIVADLQ